MYIHVCTINFPDPASKCVWLSLPSNIFNPPPFLSSSSSNKVATATAAAAATATATATANPFLSFPFLSWI